MFSFLSAFYQMVALFAFSKLCSLLLNGLNSETTTKYRASI